MTLKTVEISIKNVIVRAELFFNKLLGREFIPKDLGAFSIETSSICNLGCKFCAYDKKSSPRVNMSNEMFYETVSQAIDMGFCEFSLTPTTGDIFMDKNAFEKFDYLDEHPKVKGYHFFTNLTLLDENKINRMLSLKKLSRLTVSVYGHNEETFISITGANQNAYKKLLSNLDLLLACKDRWSFGVSIGFRSTFDAPKEQSDLTEMMKRYKQAGVGVHSSHGVFNNWGGYISQDDVANLNMTILSPKLVYKLGACVKLFDGVQVMASGIVNACSCRDVDATLRIGDISQKPLKEIISRENPEYMKLIEEQQTGEFRPICYDCDFYRSIYHQPSSYRKNNTPVWTIQEALSDKN
jgi:MoaA/NifB/PqqE/SkfB family radical SAM enzyme